MIFYKMLNNRILGLFEAKLLLLYCWVSLLRGVS